MQLFKRAVSQPIKAGDPTGLARLRVLLKAVSMRRTKALLASTLPPRDVAIHYVKLPWDAAHGGRDDYEAVHAAVQAAMQSALPEFATQLRGVLASSTPSRSKKSHPGRESLRVAPVADFSSPAKSTPAAGPAKQYATQMAGARGSNQGGLDAPTATKGGVPPPVTVPGSPSPIQHSDLMDC